MSYTIIIVVITAIISIAAFNNKDLENKLILWPREMNSPEQYYRLLTSGFIHGDWGHLLFNMYTLYSFGNAVENYMGIGWMFVVLYLTGIVVSSLPSFLKNRNNSFYRSLGASGGVSAIIFFTIYFSPWSRIGVFFIPMPSIVFALLYIAYTVYMARKGGDNINHDAHLWGCMYGMFFAFIIDPTHGVSFIDAITHPG